MTNWLLNLTHRLLTKLNHTLLVRKMDQMWEAPPPREYIWITVNGGAIQVPKDLLHGDHCVTWQDEPQCQAAFSGIKSERSVYPKDITLG